MIQVLVTGAGGQLGLSLKDALAGFPQIKARFCTSEDLDITKPETMQQHFGDETPDYCINCAAFTDVEAAEKAPEQAFKINAEGVKNLTETCKEYGTILIHISTDYVFDGEKKEGYLPSDPPNPINEYGRSKLAGEQVIQEVLDRYFIIRTSWLYSKKYGRNFYKTVLEKARRGEQLRITDQQTGCPTDTLNLSAYIIELILSKNNDYGIHHFTDGKAMSWYDFAGDILRENGLLKSTKLTPGNNYITFARRPRNSTLLQNLNN
ncbi:dTDP-4-dehydrorhamnose reductase [Robiginitalea sp. IMCC43444]|uniref:dTDP-4-dehydrorhamnose reductase n=1 Tax=Robiginitalea sp. IMCC43444 TaxID=3459121 RepID=UPI0040418E2C